MPIRLYPIWFFTAVLCIALSGCIHEPEVKPTVGARADFPDGGRASACACTMGDKAYVFGGRDEAQRYRNDLWCYDGARDEWSSIGVTPMSGRVNATIAASGDKLYMGLGYSAKKAYNDTAYCRDWWEYTPATKQWKRLADYPTGNTVACASFAKDGFVYALYGFGYGFSRDIWRYSIAEDRWEQVRDTYHMASPNFGGCGAWCHGAYYYGTGYNTHMLTQWYEADVAGSRWTQRSSIPGKGRHWCACTATDGHVYLFGGRYFAGELTGGEVFDSYLRYAPEQDRWEWCGTMPCGRAENMIAFTIDGNAYFGLGEDEKGTILNTLYKIEN